MSSEITTEFDVDEVVEQTESLGNLSKEILISDKKLAKICKTNLTLHPKEFCQISNNWHTDRKNLPFTKVFHVSTKQTAGIKLLPKFSASNKIYCAITVAKKQEASLLVLWQKKQVGDMVANNDVGREWGGGQRWGGGVLHS
ncbi:Uncharacterized protein Fot_15840 [Forsythia ovata]|uniref:Uncharacterized protein n=1 Tax=Forsythia ovata TaxID=205694 RepID=A0ABD1WAJ7_9LAMI